MLWLLTTSSSCHLLAHCLDGSGIFDRLDASAAWISHAKGRGREQHAGDGARAAEERAEDGGRDTEPRPYATTVVINGSSSLGRLAVTK